LLAALLSAAVLAQSSSNARNQRRQKPNIIFILADDLGIGDVGAYGQTKIRTPHIDRLAAEGMKFTDFYAGSPVCAPSRCVLMTGKHGGHAYIRDNREHKPEGQAPIPSSVFYDVMPTLAELAGAEPPKNTDGVSFAPTLLGKGKQRRHEFLFWDFNGYGGQQAVRLGDWKGLRRNLHRGNTKLELYNLATDIGEQHDVADRHPEIVQRIAAILQDEHTRCSTGGATGH
jgi:arylsulfatase A-like enzyme